MNFFKTSLESLPIELLYEIQLYALSESFPLTSKHFYNLFKFSRASYQAEYILSRVTQFKSHKSRSELLSKALLYPACTKPVLEAVCHRIRAHKFDFEGKSTKLPKRLFKHLGQPGGTEDIDLSPGGERTNVNPLPFLRYIFENAFIPSPDANSHDGYPLVRAVNAVDIRLVRFLLSKKAYPERKNGLALSVAIRRKHLVLFRILVERSDESESETNGRGKRRRVQDRVKVDSRMLREAVMCGAKEIADYLLERRVIPDMETLQMMLKR